MIGARRVLAVVPARGGSKGLPGKNLRLVGGKPLVAWAIGAGLGCEYVDRVICSTDDPAIADAAVSAGAQVPFMRPAALASDTTSSNAVLLDVLDRLAEAGDWYDDLVLLQPTSPLTDSGDVARALVLLDGHRASADAVVAVGRVESGHPMYSVRRSSSGLIRPAFDDSFEQLCRRQDLPELYRMCGSVYAGDVSAYRLHGGFYSDRTLGLVMPRYKTLDVDDLLDLICVEAVMGARDRLASAG